MKFWQKNLPQVLLLWSLTGVPAFATTPGPQLKDEMRIMAQSMLDLFPALCSRSAFTDPKNQEFIEKRLQAMSSTFSQVGDHFKAVPLTRKISYQLVLEHIQDTQRVFSGPNKKLAQNMLKATTQMCISCHSMDNQERSLFKDLDPKQFSSDFEWGEFHYMTRDAQKALTAFNHYLQTPEAKDNPDNLELALRRELAIYLRILKDPQEAIKNFEALNSDSHFPDFAKNMLKEWLEELRGKDFQQLEKQNNPTLPQIEKLVAPLIKEEGVESLIRGRKEVRSLWAVNQIYTYLMNHNKKTPQLLYWLANLEEGQENNLFYPLAQVYLKECVEKFPGNPYAKKCYQEYADYIQFSFTGSSGTHIPAEIEAELKQLRSHLSAKGKRHH